MLTAEAEYTGQSFDLQAYLERSQKLDLTGIDFDAVPTHPVDPGEIRCLKYMMDIEAHTLCYLGDILNAGGAEDPEIADFLGCWLYEESFHSRAIARYVQAAGYPWTPDNCGQRRFTLAEKAEHLGHKLASKLVGRDFVAVHMTWGAIQEHSTLCGYTVMAKNTRNPVLAELLRRIARDESRHFGFYLYKAQQRLKDNPRAQRLVAFLLKRFWTPVGEGVKPRSETDFMLRTIFAGEDGRAAIARIDGSMRRLPGLAWFDLMTRRLDQAWIRSPIPS
jgi:rubrerythrin